MRTLLLIALLLSAPVVHASLAGDVNNDGTVNLQDLLAVLQHVGRTKAYQASVDLNSDGAVNLFDLVTVSRDWGKTAPTNSTLPAGLILGYSFDDGTATDLSGNNLDGVISGATSVQGYYGGALSFDGIDDLVNVGSPAIIDDLSSMTMTMWVRTSGSGYIISKRDSCSGYWRLDITNGNINWLTFRGGMNVQSSSTVAADTWTHIAISWDGTNTATGTRLYINGVEATNPGTANTAQSDASCSLRIGAREGTSAFFDGLVDEVRLYGRALSAAEISTDMDTPFGGNYTPPPDATPPQLSNGQPNGMIASGTTSLTISAVTNEPATCKYGITAGQTYASMANTFSTTGSTTHSTSVNGLSDGQSYTYYVRCQDGLGNTNTNDYSITFTVAPAGGVQPLFFDDFETGDLSTATNGVSWRGTGTMSTGNSYSGQYAHQFLYNGYLVTGADPCTAYVRERRFNLPNMSEVWMDYMLYIPSNYVHPYTLNSGLNCSSNDAHHKLFRMWGQTNGDYGNNDPKAGASFYPLNGGPDSFSSLQWGDHNSVMWSTQYPGSLWQPGFGDTHRGRWTRISYHVKLGSAEGMPDGVAQMYVDGVKQVDLQGLDWYSPSGNYFGAGYLMGNVNKKYAQDTIFYIDDFKIYGSDPGWDLPADTTPPTLNNGQPSGTLASGTTNTTLRITTDEAATCKYSATLGQSYSSMPNTFTTTGGTSHSRSISGLTDGQNYNYYIRCQDTAANANTNDLAISFSVANAGPVQPVFYDDFETGDRTHTQNGYFWKATSQPNLAVENTKSVSGQYSLRFLYPGKPDCQDSTTEQRMAFGEQLDEIWLEYYFYVPDGSEGGAPFHHRSQANLGCGTAATNNKFLRIWGAEGTYGANDPKWGASFDAAGTTGNSNLYAQWGDGNNAMLGGQDPTSRWYPWVSESNAGSVKRGNWVHIRWHGKLASAAGAADGVIQLWADGVLKVNMSGIDFYPVSNPPHFETMYLLGWSNSGYHNDTYFFIDDVAIYNQNPGW